jgi:hypothetical protein
MFLAIIGISLEVAGFVFMINSTRRLVFRAGDFGSEVHVDPKTCKVSYFLSYSNRQIALASG